MRSKLVLPSLAEIARYGGSRSRRALPPIAGAAAGAQLVGFASANSGATVVGSQAAPSLTWQTGDILVCFAVAAGAAGTNTWNTPTNTGSGLTWSAAQIHNTNPTSDAPMGSWTTTASASSSGVITISGTGTSFNQPLAIGVFQVRALPGFSVAVGTSRLVTGAGASPQNGSITMTGPDSLVCWAAGDWSAGAIETPSPAATSHTSVSPGPTAAPVSTTVSGQYTFYFDDLDDQTSTGSQTYGYTGTSAGPFTIIIVEIAVSAAASPVPPPYIPHRMPLGV